jgi:hypothetical protein
MPTLIFYLTNKKSLQVEKRTKAMKWNTRLVISKIK